jgi:HPt (histidine-containing phosphotransfer) domain-containing protein
VINLPPLRDRLHDAEHIARFFLQSIGEKEQRRPQSFNRQALKVIAHTFKGSSGMMGAMALSRLCFDMERKMRDGSLDGAEELLEQIKTEFRRVEVILSGYLKERKGGDFAMS